MASNSIEAVVVKSVGNVTVEKVTKPKLKDDFILVKTLAVGLNPTDWQHAYLRIGGDPTDTRVGCDYVGIVEEVGPRVTKPFKKGDRVAGVVHGSNALDTEDGAFAEYIVAKGDLQIKCPENLSDEAAATLGVGVSTVGQALYQVLELALPTKPLSSPVPVLIYGGSTATGSLAIQFAKASGYTVLTTASPSHHDYLRDIGADGVFDYNSPTWFEDAKSAAHGQLKLAFDCIGSADTGRSCAMAMSEDAGGRYTATEDGGPEVINQEFAHINARPVLAYTIEGRDFVWGTSGEITFKGQPEDFDFGVMFWETARKLLESGQVKPVRSTANLGGKGLEGVLFGLEELRQGKVRGGKLVYSIE